MNEYIPLLLNGVSILGGDNEHIIELEGDIKSIEVSSAGRIRWDIGSETGSIRTGFINYSTDTARLNQEGRFTVTLQNREKLAVHVYLRISRNKP